MTNPEADALFAKAAAALAGDGVAQDFAVARDMFRRAGEAGRIHGAVIHANLVANGTGGAPDWQGGVALLRALAGVNSRSRRELDIVEAMDLTPEGDPRIVPEGETLCESPYLVRYGNFLTTAECSYLTEAAAPMLAPAVVVDTATGRQVRDPVRTSDGIGFTWPLENPAIHAFNRRIAVASGTSVEQGEPLQVLRYRPGEQYRAHFDAIPGFANQRVLTMLIWLKDGFAGGETHFPKAGLSLTGRAGDALLFRNIGPDGRRDPNAVHAGLPVTSGEKVIASRWIRERRFEMPVAGQPVG